MKSFKKCSGCRKELGLDNFYKNKNNLDGHGIYCKSCAKINSKKYFENKKMKRDRIVQNEILKFTQPFENNRTEKLMKILMIEKMCKSMLEELGSLKSELYSPQSIKTTNKLE